MCLKRTISHRIFRTISQSLFLGVFCTKLHQDYALGLAKVRATRTWTWQQESSKQVATQSPRRRSRAVDQYQFNSLDLSECAARHHLTMNPASWPPEEAKTMQTTGSGSSGLEPAFSNAQNNSNPQQKPRAPLRRNRVHFACKWRF